MSLQKESEGKLITAMGMMAENMQRQALGESMAYIESDFVNLLEDHKCGGDLCIVCGYREKIKESEWEKEVRGVCRQDYIEQSEVDALVEYIQKAIAASVSTREKEIAEEVEKMKETEETIGGMALGYNTAIKDVLSILKH